MALLFSRSTVALLFFSQEANCFCHSNFDARRQPPSLNPQIARSLRYFLFRENGIIIQDFLITCLASRGKGWWR